MTGIDSIRDIRTEVDVLASFLSDLNVYKALTDSVRHDMFTDRDCLAVYDAIREIEQEGKTVELTGVGMKVYRKGVDITRFIQQTYNGFEVTREKVSILADLAAKRRLYQLGIQAMTVATTPTSSSDDFKKILRDFTESMEDSKGGVVMFKEAVHDLETDIVKRNRGEVQSGMRTGLHIFDCRNGFHSGDLVIIAGETSQGKSTLATTIACNMAKDGVPTVYYSLEMSARQLTARMIARDVDIPASRLLYAKLSSEEYNKFYDTALSLSSMPIFYDEHSRVSFEKICSSIRALVREKGVRVAFIDYLQILANGDASGSREQLLGDMARDLKRLAVDTGVCVVALSQLSRDPNSKDGEPRLSRLRGSGQIEEACDMAVLIWRPSLFGINEYDDGTKTAGTARLNLAKGRNVGTGRETVIFDGDLTYFRNDDGSRPAERKEDYNLPF